ncbi:hypothetical protein HQQ81_07400 [Microbacteriaceae bacterium VKM Ac-2854]|nr:hypothetical protein [Microbacteriaceae bacterium VKM Ac-2854]
MDTIPSNPSRRSVVGAAAWAAPAVAVALAAPTASASGSEPDVILDSYFEILTGGTPVRVNWKYGIRVGVTNSGPLPYTGGFTLELSLTADPTVVCIGGLAGALDPASTPGWTFPTTAAPFSTLSYTFSGTVPANGGTVEAIITAAYGVIAFSAPDLTALPYSTGTSEMVLTPDPLYSSVNLAQGVTYNP